MDLAPFVSLMNSELKLADFTNIRNFISNTLLGIVNTEGCHSHYFRAHFCRKSLKTNSDKRPHAPESGCPGFCEAIRGR